MRSTPSSRLESAIALVDALPAAEPGLGSSVAEEVALLGRLAERVRVSMLERLAVLDTSGVAASQGCASTATWLVARLGLTRNQADTEVYLARALHVGDRRLERAAGQVGDGSISTEQSRIIVRAVTDLPAECVPQAEALMLEAARRLAPAQLSVVARRLRRVLVDDPAARAEMARGDRYLRLTPALYGMWAIDGLVDAETGAALQAGFDALLAQRVGATTQTTPDPSPATLGADPRPTSGGDVNASGDVTAAESGDVSPERPTAAQRRADALGEIVRGWLESGGAPRAGGTRPQLVVTIDSAALTGQNPTGLAHVRPDSRTGAGTEIGPDTARRLGCDPALSVVVGRGAHPEVADPAVDAGLLARMFAGIAPALGGLTFEPLALGRTARLVSTAQRLALNARDRGCVAPGCQAGPERCEAHHLVFWADGGSSDLDNLALVCAWHHHLVHERAWTLRRHPSSGVVSLTHPPNPPPAPDP